MEEFGGLGSSYYKFKYTPSFVCVLDRKGNFDIIDTIYNPTLPQKLRKRIIPIAKKHKFFSGHGMFCDLVNFNYLGVSGINISSGYYNPHTKYEYVSVPDMEKTEKFVVEMLNRIGPEEYPLLLSNVCCKNKKKDLFKKQDTLFDKSFNEINYNLNIENKYFD